MTTITWMAQVPARTEAEREADREKLLSDLEKARERLAREERRRESAPPGEGSRR